MNEAKIRFRFTRNFDWLTRHCVLCRAVTVAYLAGHDLFVTPAVADAAEQAGAGERVAAND